MEVRKVTVGFVTQVFDTETGKWVSQEFTANDQVDWEDMDGNTIDPDDFVATQEGKIPYLCFDMKDPSEIPSLEDILNQPE